MNFGPAVPAPSGAEPPAGGRRARQRAGGELGRRGLLLGAAAAGLGGCLDFHAGSVAAEPKGSTFAKIEGARIHYVDRGEGPPVLLVHGFASSLNTWRGVMKALEPKHRVIALDLKGFGLSDRPPGDYSPAAEAAILLGLLDHLGVKEPVRLVAHSWGSSVALRFTLLHPERVERIALYDAWVYESQLPTTFLWSRADGLGEMLIGAFYDERPDDKMAIAFYDKSYVTEELVESVEEQLDRPGTKAAALAAIRGQRFSEVEKLYKNIDKPALLLWGREDRVTTLEFGERLSKELKRARLVVYPQCGHFPMIEAATPSTRDLVEFVEQGAAPATAPSVAPAPNPKPAAAPEEPKKEAP